MTTLRNCVLVCVLAGTNEETGSEHVAPDAYARLVPGGIT